MSVYITANDFTYFHMSPNDTVAKNIDVKLLNGQKGASLISLV